MPGAPPFSRRLTAWFALPRGVARAALICAALLCAGLLCAPLGAAADTGAGAVTREGAGSGAQTGTDTGQLRVSLDAARSAAAGAMMSGRAGDALALSEAVLKGAPDDLSALFIRARALRDLGREAEALEAARAAWTAARDPRDRFYAAMMMAQTRSSVGNNGLAQLWLRRAAHLAPEEGLKAMAVEDFRHVRRLTPWRLALDFYVAPSDNLNNASDEATVTSAGWTAHTTPPLSGERIGGGAQLRYTVALAERRRLHLGGFGGASFVRLSEAARDVPGVSAGDYAQGYLGGTLSLEAINAGRTRLNRADLTLFRQWQGGAALADVARLDLSTRTALTPKLSLGLSVGLEDITRRDSSDGDSQRRALGLVLTQRFDHGALTLDLGVGQTLSAAYNVGRRDGDIRLGYAWAEPVRGMLPSVDLSYGAFNYDAPWIVEPNGPDRRDRQWALEVDVLLPDLDYYGFAPEIGLSFTDRTSNYTLYESRSTDLRLGLKSVF